MSGPPTTPSRQLWTPSRGISFASAPKRILAESSLVPAAPKPPATNNPQSSYPTLNLARFIHNEAVGRIHEPVNPSNGDSTESAPVSASPAGQTPAKTSLPGLPKDGIQAKTTGSPRRPAAAPKISWQMAFSKPISHPENDLEWKIPNDLFAQSRKSKDGDPGSFYSHTLYRGPGRLGAQSRVTVHYCRSVMTTEQVCQKHFLDEPVIGFDLEWEADAMRWDGARANVSLVQIATPSRVALFHLALFPRKNTTLVSPTLKKILEDPNVIKCGVMILGDFSRLRAYLGLSPRGALELSHYHNLVTFCKLGKKGSVPKKAARLADQVEQVLGLPLYKGMDVRASEWSRELKMDQIYYSASDAYAGLQLYAVYEHERKKLRPCPPRPPLAELGLKIETKGEDGINEDEELAFLEAEVNKTGTVTIEDKFLASKTTRTVAQTTKTRETEEAILTTTTMATATIIKTTFTTATPQKQGSRGTQSSSAKNPISAPEIPTVATQRPTATKPVLRKRRSTITSAANNSMPLDPRVADATAWAQDFVNTHSGTVPRLATMSYLRAYRLWAENPTLSIADIAALLRDPPLLSKTVAVYIWEVIRLHSALRPDGGQGLAVDIDRVFEDVLRRVGRKRTPAWTLDAVNRQASELPLWGIDEKGNEIGKPIAGASRASEVVAAEENGAVDMAPAETMQVREGHDTLTAEPVIEVVNVNVDSDAADLDDNAPVRKVDAIYFAARESGYPEETGREQEDQNDNVQEPDPTERSISPSPSETDLFFALDRELAEATEKEERMKMSNDRKTWEALGVGREEPQEQQRVEEQEQEGFDDAGVEGIGEFRSMSPSPSEMEVLMLMARDAR